MTTPQCLSCSSPVLLPLKKHVPMGDLVSAAKVDEQTQSSAVRVHHLDGLWSPYSLHQSGLAKVRPYRSHNSMISANFELVGACLFSMPPRG